MSGSNASRPGLRERRLSRVHFDGDETPAVEQLSLETPQPLNLHHDRDQDSGKQEYFDAPVHSQASPARLGQGGDETTRGRPSNAGPSPIRANMVQDAISSHSGHMQVPSLPVNMDVSPRTTGFASAAQQSASPIYAPPPGAPVPQWQSSPRGLPPAHLKGSPQIPAEPYYGAVMHNTPRANNGEWADPERERRASAPAADHAPRAHAATYSKGGRFSVDSGRDAQAQAPPAPDNYTALPVKRFDHPGAPHQPQFQQGPIMYPAAPGAQGNMPLQQQYAMYAFPPQGPLPPYQPPVQQQRQPALKPALRRTQTEEEARRTTRNAVDIVHSHTQGLRQRRPGQDDELATEKARNAGVLSNLLQLYGTSTVPRRSNSADSKWDCESTAISRSGSADSHAPQAGRRGMQRMESAASVATTLYEEDYDQYDPRVRDKAPTDDEKARPAPPGSRVRRYSYSGGDDAASIRSKRSFKDLIRRRRSFALDEDAVYSDLTGKQGTVPVNSQTRKRRLSITKHVAHILQRHNFILKLAKALMTFGSPSHRLESQLAATSQVLEVDAQFIHLPTVVIASFGDPDTHTSETHFVKASGGLDLGKLQEVHNVYRKVVHDEMGVQEASAALSRLLKSDPIYSTWQRMLLAACAAGVVCPMGFGGSFVDALVSACFGALLAFLQHYVVRKSAMYSNIFEISVATITSFIARGLSTTQYFCYPALASSGVVLILPGYAILCGSLELASKNLVAGSVRMVYSIIYSLFLGFGIAIGSDFYFLVDPTARKGDNSLDGSTAYTLEGTFSALNGTSPYTLSGSWTFNNSTRDAAHAALFKGDVACPRDPSWQWWRSTVSPYFLFAFVPIFALLICLSNMTPVKNKQLPVMIAIACAGWVTNNVANRYIFNHSDVVSFLGSFVVGILGNMYSRVFKGTGFVVMVPGVLFMVPSGIAAAGGLAMTETGANGDSYSNGLVIGFRMVQVAIGITVGLFFSSFVVYSFGRRKQAALFAF